MGYGIEDIPILKDIIEMLYAKKEKHRLEIENEALKKELRETQHKYITALREKRKMKK